MVTIPMIVMVVGLIVYLMKTTPKVQRTGEIMFGAGLLVVLYALATKVII
jgi:Na+/phosphate symporter